MSKFLFFSWLAIAISVFLYSYGFVDFNLTLSSQPWVMAFVTWSQQLAMFNRGRSTNVYLALIGTLFLFYLVVLSYYARHPASRFPWKQILTLALVFTLAYPLLSSDVFKYLFAAKELVLYHTNPHVVAPQVFEGDTWLRFMRWIHTPSPYGPVMTALAIPPYLLALGKFVPALYLFKLAQLGWYLLSIWLIGRLAANRKVVAQLVFALNPLILVEWLTNAHNDAPMITLLLLALYLIKIGKRIPAFLVLLLSIGIKYVTVFGLLYLTFQKLPRKIMVALSLIILTLAPLLYHYSYQYQPWYVTWIIPFVALSGVPALIWLATAYSLGAFLRYLPFIGTGLWQGTAQYFALLTFAPIAATAIYLLLKHILRRLPQEPKNQL